MKTHNVSVVHQLWGKDEQYLAILFYQVEDGKFDDSCPTVIVTRTDIFAGYMVFVPNYSTEGPDHWVVGNDDCLHDKLIIGLKIANGTIPCIPDESWRDGFGEIVAADGDVLLLDL